MGERVAAAAPASSREHLRRSNRNPAPLFASAEQKRLAFIQRAQWEEGTRKIQYAEIGLVNNRAKEAANAVAGDERVLAAMPPLTKRAQQLQQDFTRIIGRGLTRRGAWPT